MAGGMVPVRRLLFKNRCLLREDELQNNSL